MWKFLVFFMFAGGSGSQAGPSTSRSEYDIITSQRGKPIRLRAGHKYNLERKKKDGSCVWRCSKRSICKAILTVTGNTNIIRDDKHDCIPDFTSNELEKSFNECIEEVKEDCTTPVPNIFRKTVASLKDKGLDLIKKKPNYHNIKKKLYRKRNRTQGARKLCFKLLKQVTVPQKFQNFVLADYHTSNRILVFACENAKAILANQNLTILGDGTFKFCLKPFKQLYTLHLDLGSNKLHNNIIPVIYALLANKKKETYTILFRLIRSQIPEFNPKTIILDFEQAAILAIKKVYPEIRIRGCYFHFSNSLWRKAEDIGITKSALARKHIKRCTALAHLPKDAIDNGWLYIMSQCPNDEKIHKFNDYFVETYLNETSLFANIWSCNNGTIHRTTNMVENWHSIVNKQIIKKPQNIAHFLTILQREDNYYQTLYLKGSPISKKLKETCAIDEHIECTVNEFIRGVISLELCIERLVL